MAVFHTGQLIKKVYGSNVGTIAIVVSPFMLDVLPSADYEARIITLVGTTKVNIANTVVICSKDWAPTVNNPQEASELSIEEICPFIVEYCE